MFTKLLIVLITTMSPIVELRGAIPLGIALGLPVEFFVPFVFVVNCLIFFPIYFGLELFYDHFFERFEWFRKIIENIHKKGSRYVGKYGILGLAVFVGIPLPVTGVWTGTGIAWLLGIEWKKSFLAICLGVLIVTCIITSVSLGILTGLNFFAKGI
jgi:uncharacterized membrane protein